MDQLVTPAVGRQIHEGASLIKFTNDRINAGFALEKASRLPELPDHLRIQGEVAAKLAQLRLHRIVGTGNEHDATALADNLRALCRIIDPLIQSIGQMAQHELGVCPKDVKNYFTDQLLGAIDGNAVSVLEGRAEEIIEERRAEVAESRLQRRRDGE